MDMVDMPDEELIKEVFYRFGLAYYESECLHKELCNIYALREKNRPVPFRLLAPSRLYFS
jgi:hypothetical protein